jgi:antitoxin component HigA of HigAB toxin-antitoxin module
MKLPSQFEELVRWMPPQAITDDVQYENTVEVIDGLMSRRRLTRGQSVYLETLVQLVQAYEAARHSIDTSNVRPLETLEYLLVENQMSATDLASLLEVHPSMGSKILKGERALTVAHIRKLAERFRVNPSIFIE